MARFGANEPSSRAVTERRRILIASYHFPPDTAVGGLRSSKFARFLPEFGWEPYVLTVKDEYRDEGIDLERLEGLEGITVVRTAELPSLKGVYFALMSRLLKRRQQSVQPVPRVMERPATADGHETIVGRIKRYVTSLIVLLPDEKKTWSFYAWIKAVRLIRQAEVEYILTSSPPASAHFIGLMAKVFTNVRWIADFRDPWLDLIHERSPLSRSKASDTIERWMERMVMTHADKVLTTTNRFRQVLSERYPACGPDKFVCVPNSIDTGMFRLGDTVQKDGPLIITYAGSLYLGRTPEPLFLAVQQLIGGGQISAADIRITLLGDCGYINGVATGNVAKQHGLESVVQVLEPVPYSEALQIMQKSHLLLVIAPNGHRLCVPAKVFDYLGSGAKILALTEQGATSDLIEETGSGRCFSQTDVAGLREYLHALIKDRAFAQLRNRVDLFQPYDVKYLTGRLVGEMLALAD